MLEHLSVAFPDFNVSATGEIVGIPNISEFQARLCETLRASIAKDTSVPADKLIESATSKRAIGQAVSEQWNACVGVWAGEDLELDASYQFETEDVVPALANQVVAAGESSRGICLARDRARQVTIEELPKAVREPASDGVDPQCDPVDEQLPVPGVLWVIPAPPAVCAAFDSALDLYRRVAGDEATVTSTISFPASSDSRYSVWSMKRSLNRLSAGAALKVRAIAEVCSWRPVRGPPAPAFR